MYVAKRGYYLPTIAPKRHIRSILTLDFQIKPDISRNKCSVWLQEIFHQNEDWSLDTIELSI